MSLKAFGIAVATATVLLASSAGAATLKASYGFNGNFNSSVGGAPSLVLTDPLGTSSFVTDTVYGNSRTVFDNTGSASPTSNQGGLMFDSTGLLTVDSYSVALTLEFLGGANAWRRILDVEDRQSDNGFYVDPDNKLNVFPVSGSGVDFTTGEYHTVVMTVASDGAVTGYIDGLTGALSVNTSIMNIQNGQILLFLDNTVAGGQGEWYHSRIAQADFYDGVLTQTEVGGITGVPETGTWALMLMGFGGLGALLRRRRAVEAVSAA